VLIVKKGYLVYIKSQILSRLKISGKKYLKGETMIIFIPGLIYSAIIGAVLIIVGIKTRGKV